MDEKIVLKRIIGGERSLFRILVDNYKDISLTLAYSIVRNQEEAEDIVQDAFIKAYMSLPRFNFKSSFRTWFYRIVVNTSYHSLEKSKTRKTSPIDHGLISLETSNLNGYDAIRANERKQIIHSALAHLKINEALILELYYLGEQSNKEIAEITGMSLSNIKVTMHRARKNFFEQLKRIAGNEKDDIL